MDLSMSFDCLPFDLLIEKLATHGTNLSSLRLIKNYLSNRFHKVKIGSDSSEWLKIVLGVPQGSILGPLIQ